MEVEVVHRLAPMTSPIDHQAVPTVSDPLGAGYLVGHAYHAPQEGAVILLQLGHRLDVLVGNHQDVNRRLRADVTKGGDHLISMKHLGLASPAGYLAEDAFARSYGQGCSLQSTKVRLPNSSFTLRGWEFSSGRLISHSMSAVMPSML